ncbi:hypothetical protein PoB_007306500 [Plakobranchus ocellatus]|uniref:Uncharacterized protein n=1 Tax=Plakobranchus ocellatus TaxID=259542 RepID=A0AAV4DR73_9GAST|nr:hypothetical protein PoB_007306500 [Plakobranchus ocellatus]
MITRMSLRVTVRNTTTHRTVPPLLDPKTIIASLTSRANTELSNEESEHADSSMPDDDNNDPGYAPSTINKTHLTDNDSFTATENGFPTVTTRQNAPFTKSPVSRTSRSQDTDTNSPAL